MSATIFTFPTVRVERCDAAPEPALTPREALIKIAKDQPFPVAQALAEIWADQVLAKLWIDGFIVVPASDKVLS